MQLVCVCISHSMSMCVVLIVVLLICGCINCTLIFKISRMHTYRLCAYISVWEGGGCGAAWGGVVMWVGKREKEMDVWV